MPSTDKAKSTAQKKRLGRGLGSLLSTDVGDFDKEAPKKQAEGPKEQLKSTPERTPTNPVPGKTVSREIDPGLRIWNLAIEKIAPNSTQPRKDFMKEPLDELSQSIKEQGVLQPITVRKKGDRYEIIAGERRWRASQAAGLQQIPAIIKNVDDQKSMELALIENLQREDLNPVEEAMGYQLLIDDYSLSQQDLATRVGKSRSAVTNSLRVLTLPRDVRQMLRQGLISVGHAKVLLGVEDVKKQIALAKKVVQKKLSVRALEKELRRKTTKTSADIEGLSVSDRLVSNLAAELQKSLGTRVKISYKDGKGRIEIAFYSDDELSSLCEKIKNAKA
jgi:ParB family chromosome partitioning protein